MKKLINLFFFSVSLGTTVHTEVMQTCYEPNSNNIFSFASKSLDMGTVKYCNTYYKTDKCEISQKQEPEGGKKFESKLDDFLEHHRKRSEEKK